MEGGMTTSHSDFAYWLFAKKSIPESPNWSDTSLPCTFSFELLRIQCRWITNARCACAWHSEADGLPSLHMEHLGYLLGIGPVLTSLFQGKDWQILSCCLRHTAWWGQCLLPRFAMFTLVMPSHFMCAFPLDVHVCMQANLAGYLAHSAHMMP